MERPKRFKDREDLDKRERRLETEQALMLETRLSTWQHASLERKSLMYGFTVSPAAMQWQNNPRGWLRMAEVRLGSVSLNDYHWLAKFLSAGPPTPRVNSLIALIMLSERSI